MIWTTESSTVSASAPGYIARIEIDGGAIGGYWETGSFTIAIAPASIIAIATTQAKTGRFRKNLDMAAPLLRRRRPGLRGAAGRGLRVRRRPGGAPASRRLRGGPAAAPRR